MNSSPENILINLGKKFPSVWKDGERAFLMKGKELPKWPAYCFVPMAGWYAALTNHYGTQTLKLDQAENISKVAALGAWRYSQGIYRFSADLYQSLLDSKFNGNIPIDVLLRLPEWCVFIETPHLGFRGFWAHIEVDSNTNRNELRVLLLDDKDNCTPLILHIGNWMLFEGIDKVLDEAEKQMQIANFQPCIFNLKNHQFSSETEKIWSQILPLILYLCSENPDIINIQSPTTKPTYYNPVKTKMGTRLFPSANTTLWTVGEEIQNIIRGSKSQVSSISNDENEDRKSPIPHIRKAHWHGYWIGAKNAQKFIFKWIPPTLISGRD